MKIKKRYNEYLKEQKPPCVLTQGEQKQLIKLGKKIVKDLSCNLNHKVLPNMPCRTCRLSAVELMKKYFLIHI